MVTIRKNLDEDIIVDESDTYDRLSDIDGTLAATYVGVMDSKTVKLRTSDPDGNRQGYDPALDAEWEIDPGTPFARKTTLRQQRIAAGKMQFNGPPPTANQSKSVKQAAAPQQYGPPPVAAAGNIVQQMQEFLNAFAKQSELQVETQNPVVMAAPANMQYQTVAKNKRVTFVSQHDEEIVAEYADVIVEELVLVLVAAENTPMRFFPKNPNTSFSIRIDTDDEFFVIRPSGVSFEHGGFTYCLLARVQV
jgi:hypothetical protein